MRAVFPKLTWYRLPRSARQLGLVGLLPSGVKTMELQAGGPTRSSRAFSDLATGSTWQRDRNEVCSTPADEHIEDDATDRLNPTVGLAISGFSTVPPIGGCTSRSTTRGGGRPRAPNTDCAARTRLWWPRIRGILGIGTRARAARGSRWQDRGVHRGGGCTSTGDPGGAGYGHDNLSVINDRDVPGRPAAGSETSATPSGEATSPRAELPARHAALGGLGAATPAHHEQYADQCEFNAKCRHRGRGAGRNLLGLAVTGQMRTRGGVIHDSGRRVGIADRMVDVMVREGLTRWSWPPERILGALAAPG